MIFWLALIAVAASDWTYDAAAAKALYLENCGTCHLPDGSGVPFLQPALTQSARIKNGDPEKTIAFILKGSDLVPAETSDYDNIMPRFEVLTNEQIALIATYVRRTFGGHSNILKPGDVKQQRQPR